MSTAAATCTAMRWWLIMRALLMAMRRRLDGRSGAGILAGRSCPTAANWSPCSIARPTGAYSGATESERFTSACNLPLEEAFQLFAEFTNGEPLPMIAFGVRFGD